MQGKKKKKIRLPDSVGKTENSKPLSKKTEVVIERDI